MKIIHDYHILHSIPEPDRELPKTILYVQTRLKELKCKLFSPVKGSICAFFDFGRKTAIAFRADMDALPIQENTQLPWQSRHPGMMHACGHDGHTAILLELARRVDKEKVLNHNILLIFQPAEETTGGAKSICQSNILSVYNVCAIFGLHLWPGLPKGQLFSKNGVLMSRSCGVSVEFIGKSVHIANTDKGNDALAACCRFLCIAEKIQLPFPFRLKFGKISGGTAPNIICGYAKLEGSLRVLSENNLKMPQSLLKHLCSAISKQTSCISELTFSVGYPPVINDKKLLNAVQKSCPIHTLMRTFWTADDFSFYQQQIPGVYFLLGVGSTPSLHSANFTFDEAVLLRGADVFFHLCKEL